MKKLATLLFTLNFLVTKTIQGIKDRRDEFLEKAIEIARQK